MATYNCTLRTGDVLLYQRTGILGWAITAWTGGDRSHAGVVLNGWGRHWVCDAAVTGISLRPVSSDLLTGGIIRVRRIPEGVTVTPDMERRLADFAISRVGVCPYGTGKMLANAWTEVFGVPPEAKDPAETPGSAMCSEWVSLLLRGYYGVDPCPAWPDRFTTPDDLDRKSKLVTVCDALQLVNK